MPVPWPPAARDALVSLLGAGRSTLAVWESLDQAGIITTLIPGWDVVRSAPQRNPVHRFTVDRHLVEAAVEASKYQRDVVPTGPAGGRGAPARHRQRAGRAPTTPRSGVELVTRASPLTWGSTTRTPRCWWIWSGTTCCCRRPPPGATWTTRRRWPRSCEAVGDVETLDLLYALTRADAAATGPVAWSDWRAALIRDLVSRVRAVTDRGPRRRPRVAADATPSRSMLGRAGDRRLVESEGPGDLLSVTVTVAGPRRPAGHGRRRTGGQPARRAGRSGHQRRAGWRCRSGRSIPTFGSARQTARLREDLRLALRGALDIAGQARAAARRAYVRTHPELWRWNRGSRSSPTPRSVPPWSRCAPTTGRARSSGWPAAIADSGTGHRGRPRGQPGIERRGRVLSAQRRRRPPGRGVERPAARDEASADRRPPAGPGILTCGPAFDST